MPNYYFEHSPNTNPMRDDFSIKHPLISGNLYGFLSAHQLDQTKMISREFELVFMAKGLISYLIALSLNLTE
jgi:hypothetical protein